MFAIIAKLFLNFESTIHFYDFRKYCDVVKRFVSMDIPSCKDILFNFVDLNHDKRVCEIDIFKKVQSVKHCENTRMIIPDMMIVLKAIETKR